MKKIMLCGLAILMAAAVAMGCTKKDSGDAAAQADAAAGSGNCVQTLNAWGQALVPLSTGFNDNSKAQAKKAIADVKAKVPANIGQSLDTISNGLEKVKSQQDYVTFAASPEYSKANTEITNYLQTECSKIGK